MAVSASTLDVQSLVSQLMVIERQPVDKLNTKVTDTQSRISSFGTLKGLVSGMQSALKDLKNSLEGYGATPADSNILSATATSSATAGTYRINITHLAQAQNLATIAQSSATSTLSTSAATIKITINGTEHTVPLATNATLEDIRDSLNSANLGFTSSIINVGGSTPYRLALTANASGTDNAIDSIVVGDNQDIADLLNFGANADPMTETAPAKNVSFSVNGIDIESATNTVTGAIQGVTLTFKTTTATATTLSISRDTSAVSTAASKFVEAYNALVSQLKSRSAYKTDTSAAGSLAGDATVRQMLDQLRGILMTPATGGTLGHLSEIGITTQAGGSMKIETGKLNDKLTSNFGDVSNLFSGADGFSTRLTAWATSVTQAGGLIDQRTDGLYTSIKTYNAQIDKLELQMTALQKRYTTTYSNLNMLLSSMNDTSKYLTSQFG